MYIRGLGTDLPTNVGESSVSTNYDGTYSIRSEAGVLGYYDLERVEVLRGPQGMLYGRNATAGVVNVVPKSPGDKFEGYASLELGNYNLVRMEGGVTIPLNEEFSTRLSYVNINRDGFLSNGLNDADAQGVRGKLNYKPNDDLKIQITYELTKQGGRGFGNVDADSYNTGNKLEPSSDTAGFNVRSYKTNKFAGNIEFTAGPGVVTFIPAYQTAGGWSQGIDGQTGLLDTKTEEPIDGEQTSAELRYSSKSDAEVQWVSGLYYYKNDTGFINSANPILNKVWSKSKAAFGQVTYPITDRFRGIAGIRASSDSKGYNNPNLANVDIQVESETWTAYDWKASIEYDMAQNVMSYFSLSTGHRPGGFNDRSENADRFDQEKLISGEFGVKSRFWDNRIQMNGSVYYYDYEGYQLSDSYVDESTDEMVSIFYNVPSVKNYGAELEVETLLGDSTLVSLSASYLHNRYDSKVILHSDTYSTNLEGKPLPHAPDMSLKGGIQHTFKLGALGTLKPNIDVRWIDKQLIAPYPGTNQWQEAYTQIDASMMYTPLSDINWVINFYVRNATNEIVKTGYFGSEYTVSTPRQFGAILNVKF